MISQLDDSQIEAYTRDGFLVVPNFLDGGELSDWRENVDEAVKERLEASEPSLTNAGDKGYYSQVFLQCIKLADTHTGVHRLMHDPLLGEMAAKLAGVTGIRIWHDQALIKPAFGNPTGWHLDNPFWSFSSRDAISLWVALDDATLGNGCMWYLPGSHKTASFENASIGESIGDLFKVYPEWRKIESVACPCKAGSVVFHNGLVAHGAGANMTNKQRRAMTCAYMPDGATFNGVRNVLPSPYFESLNIGDPLEDPAIVPLIYSEKQPA